MTGLPLVDEWAYYVSDAAFRGFLRGASQYVVQAPAMTHLLHKLPAMLASPGGADAGQGTCGAGSDGAPTDDTDSVDPVADVLLVFMLRDCDLSIRSQQRIDWTAREEWREVHKYVSSPELLPYVRSRSGSKDVLAAEDSGYGVGHDPICRIKQNAWGRYQKKVHS
jgi:hypothetical protein